MKKTLLKLGLISAILASSLHAGNYEVDKSHSNVEFKIKHLMVSNVKGSFNDFSGEISFNEETKELESIKGKAVVASIDTNNEKRDEHLKASDFFDAANHADITFESVKFEGDTVYGYLTMKGIKQMIQLEIESLNYLPKDMSGNERIGVTLEGEINRKDFGLSYNKILETGGAVLGETVKLNIELEGIKK